MIDRGARDASGVGPFMWIHAVLAVLVLFWLSSGIFNIYLNDVPGLWRWGTFAAWLALAMLFDPEFLQRWIVRMALLAPFVAILVMSLFSGSSEPKLGSYAPNIGYFVMTCSIAWFYLRPKFAKIQIFILGSMTIDLVVTGVRTFVALRADPLLSRYMATTAENQEQLFGARDLTGYAGYGYSYGLVGILVLVILQAARAKRFRLVAGVVLVVGLRFLLSVGFTYALLLLAAFVVVVIFLQLRGHARVLMGLSAVAMVLALVGEPGVMLFRWLGTDAGLSEDVAVRMNEIALLLSGDGLRGTDLNARLEHYLTSLETFAQNPLTGSAIGGPRGAYAGGHSEWLDLFAVFGLLALLLGVFMWWALRDIWIQIPRPVRTPVAVVWCYFFATGCVNTLFFSAIFWVAVVYVPLLGAVLNFLARYPMNVRSDARSIRGFDPVKVGAR